MLGWILLGGTALALWKKHENQHWTPFSSLFATPRHLNEALAHVRFTSVPTPNATSALDPGMSSEQVKSVNVVLTSEIAPAKIKEEAKNAKSLGLANTAKALEAKAAAVGEAKARGATDEEIHREQLAASSAQPPTAAVTHAAGYDGFGFDHHRGYGGFGGWEQQQHHHHHHPEFGGEQGGEMPWWMLQQQQQPMMPMQPHHHHHHHHRPEEIIEFGRDPNAQYPMHGRRDPNMHYPMHPEYATQGPHGGGHGGHFGHHFDFGGGGDGSDMFPPDMSMFDGGGF